MAAVIFGIIILASLAAALFASRGHDVLNIEGYLVGGRSFSGILLFFLAVGEIYSIGTMVGLPGGIYDKGASYGVWFLGYILLAYPVGYFLAPLIWRAGKRYGAMTLPDTLQSHYASRSLELVAAVTSLVFLVPWGELQFTGLQVAVGALGFNISPTTDVVAAALIAFAYIVISGVRAPAFVSILKDILLIAAIMIIGVAAVAAAGGPTHVFSGAENISPAASVVGGGQALTFTLTTIAFQAIGFYVGPLLAGFIFTGRSEATVKRTQIPMPLYMLMYPFLILVAYYAVSSAPGLKQPNAALFVGAVKLLPPWLVGIVAGAASLSGLLVLAGLSLVIGGIVSRNLVPGLPDTTQRRVVRVIVAVYLLVGVLLTILAPTLMLALINTAYYGFTQFLPAWLGIFFIRRFTAVGIAAGLIAGDISVLVLYSLGLALGGVNIGLVGLLINFVVTFAVSAMTKRSRLATPIAVSGRRSGSQQAERSTT